MDNYRENRFKYLKEKSKEELEQLNQEISSEIENLLETLSDENISHYERTEAMNDLSYEKDRLSYIQLLISEKISSKNK